MARTPPKMAPIKGKCCTAALINRKKKTFKNPVCYIVTDFFTDTMSSVIVELLLRF